jgi:hypothetical protein
MSVLKSNSVRFGAAAAVLLAAYAVAGFVVAPKLVRAALLRDIPAAIGASASVGEIHINPFTLQASIDHFALSSAEGEVLFSLKRLLVDFELASLWHRAYSFANIDVTAPFVNAVMAKDGRLNLLQLAPKSAGRQSASQAEPLPKLRIGSFKVSEGAIAYQDRSRPDVFALRLEPLNFELREFSTGAEGGQFTLTAASKQGERMHWQGHVSVDPIESHGKFQIDGLLAHTLWEYFQDQVNFVIDSGSIDVAATYRLSLEDPGATKLNVDLVKASLTDFTMRPRQPESATPAEPWITATSLLLTGASLDFGTRRAHVDLMSLSGLKLLTWLQADQTLNLMQLAAPPGGAAAAVIARAVSVPAPTVTASPGTVAAASAPWSIDMRQFEIRDASIACEDRSVSPAVKVLLAPLSLRVDAATQDLTKPLTVSLDTRINEAGSLTVSGQVTPKPVLADLDVKLKDLDLTTIQPYLAELTAMTLMSGTVDGDGKLHYGVRPRMPALQFTGNLAVKNLHTVDDVLHDDFIDWDRLDIEGIDFTQGPNRLDIDQILARKMYARLIFESDASINVKRVLKMPPAVVAPAGPVSAKAGATVVSRAAPVLPMSIKKIVVQASQANFSDLSVLPNFSTGIQQLEGSVIGLSSKPGSRATVALTGAIDAFSPVSITGEVNVLGPLYTDLTMSFRNISLPVFDPYSGKFAGYNIAKGKLSTELHYKVDGRKLDAQHHIVVQELEFGDRTASKEAVSLPIKLAVSLLKDRNGVIDLNIPVTGSLDDPQFRLAPIVWKAFTHILEDAASAPFAFLGSLFGGGPELQFIDFQPGVSSLDAAMMDKARSVAKALMERPGLKIDVPIALVPDIDRPALVEARYRARLASATPSFDQLDPAAQLDLLTRVYAEEVGAAPRYPEAVTGLKSKPELIAAKSHFLSQGIHEHIVVDDAELQTLGQQRAVALQRALLADPQVAAERVFLVANDKASAKDGNVRLELSLK